MQIRKKSASRPRIVHIDYIKPVLGEVDISWYQPENTHLPDAVDIPESEALSPLEEVGILPRRSRRLQHLPPM